MTYLPTIYGFKIFGQKGSAYELRYDNAGLPLNKAEVDAILANKKAGGKQSFMPNPPFSGQQQISASQMQSHLLKASQVNKGDTIMKGQD